MQPSSEALSQRGQGSEFRSSDGGYALGDVTQRHKAEQVGRPVIHHQPRGFTSLAFNGINLIFHTSLPRPFPTLLFPHRQAWAPQQVTHKGFRLLSSSQQLYYFLQPAFFNERSQITAQVSSIQAGGYLRSHK